MESSVVNVLDVGEVRIDGGGLVGVGVFFWTVGILLVLESVGLVGALAVDVPNGAVGGSRESERSLLEVPLVGEVRGDVGGIVGVVVVCRFSVFGIFLKSAGRSLLGVDRCRCRGFVGVGGCR